MPVPPPALFQHPKLSNQKKVPYKTVEMAQSYPRYEPSVWRGNRFGDATEPPIGGFGHNIEKYFSLRSRNSMFRNRRYRRPSIRRRNRRKRGIIRRSRAVSLWPRQKLVKMKMVYYYSAITGTGTIAVTAVKANSLNDPTGSLSAQLPLGLDQWAAMYQKYVVVGGKIWVRCHNVSGTGSMMYGVALKNTATTLNDYAYYLESPLSRGKMLTSDVDHSAVGLSYNAKRFWKVRKFIDAEDQQGAFSTTPGDPNDIAYFHLFAHDTSTSEAQTFEMVITQEFYVLLFDPIVPSRSSL